MNKDIFMTKAYESACKYFKCNKARLELVCASYDERVHVWLAEFSYIDKEWFHKTMHYTATYNQVSQKFKTVCEFE